MLEGEFKMNEGNNVKTAIFGWVMLAGAYVLGKKRGYDKCKSDVKDVLLEVFIDKEKEKGS